MRKLLLILLGLGLAANGLYMLAAPLAWYQLIPSVPATGPFNPHFVRDIGCAYLTCGAALLWLLRDPRAWPAVIAGAAFLSAHALVHLWDALAGRASLAHLVGDLPTVFAVPLLMLWLGWPPKRIF